MAKELPILLLCALRSCKRDTHHTPLTVTERKNERIIYSGSSIYTVLVISTYKSRFMLVVTYIEYVFGGVMSFKWGSCAFENKKRSTGAENTEIGCVFNLDIITEYRLGNPYYIFCLIKCNQL